MRMYGKRSLRTWTQMETINWKGEEREVERISQHEIGYTEYDADGNKVGAGTEDFSADRFENTQVLPGVHVGRQDPQQGRQPLVRAEVGRED